MPDGGFALSGLQGDVTGRPDKLAPSGVLSFAIDLKPA
ncbi:hypothetical protein AB07_4359 [Citrobacter freundii]|nr:hypothetical protein AB07_4359 [Citrobacter freundii]